jgi:nucleotide-binding universal stress UspA family protein
MSKRILVPLDQSPVAESIVPLVAELARGAGAVVRLLHVADEPRNLVTREGHVIAYADQEMERLRASGLAYLHTIEAKLEGVAVERAVRFGDPLEAILAEAEGFGADLIAVTTGGRGGIRRTMLGSVAEKVFNRAGVPVVLFHPQP